VHAATPGKLEWRRDRVWTPDITATWL